MYDLAIVDDNFRDSDPEIILGCVKSAYRAVAYVSRAKCAEYKCRLEPHRVIPLKCRVYGKPDTYFEWGLEWESKQVKINPPVGTPPGVKCFKVVQPAIPKVSRVTRSR